MRFIKSRRYEDGGKRIHVFFGNIFFLKFMCLYSFSAFRFVDRRNPIVQMPIEQITDRALADLH